MPVSPARAAAFDILLRVETQGAYASELLHSSRLDQLSRVDRGLTTEIAMGVLRWRSRLDDSIAVTSSRSLSKLDVEVLTALRIAAYQLQFLTRVPASAAINESVELVKRARKTSAAPFTNAVLRKLAIAPRRPNAAESDATVADIARQYAHPQWLVERWGKQFGIEVAQRICQQNQTDLCPALRFEDQTAESELVAEGVELSPGALLRQTRLLTSNVGDLIRTAAFREGRVVVQDEGSQLVALLVGTGSRLLDCCAAPGGKTAVLASRNPTAEIIAAELHPHRANLLRKRVRAENVKVIQADALELSVAGQFDRVLADVPCSGTGTLARNPEIKWRLKPPDLTDFHAKQVAILQAALSHLAPGGRAVYSTCALEPEEDEAVIEEILTEATGEFQLFEVRDELERLRVQGELAWEDLDSLTSRKCLRTIPGVHPCDGFFAAIIERLSVSN